MNKYVLIGIILPFTGTALGAATVFLMKKEIGAAMSKALAGFASGVMIAASIWSLLLPSLEMSAERGKLSWIPAAAGFLVGVFFLLALDRIIPHLHANSDSPEGPKTTLKKTTMLVLAVTLHNVPEGMAVGVVLAGLIADNELISVTAALALAVGIAVQNFPEGAIISMPLRSEGVSKFKAFVQGALSGIVEPIAAIFTILMFSTVSWILPYLLSFAAGAMIYVVVEELIPESQTGGHSDIGTISVAVGFALMMILDVALG